MKKIKKFFVLFTMLIAGLSFKGANNIDKNVVADAAEPGSYAYFDSGWKSAIKTALSAQGVNNDSLIKTILVTNDASKVPMSGYLDGCPVEAGRKGDRYTPEAYYTNACAVATYVYPNVTDTTMFDCIFYADVETIYALGAQHFARLSGIEKITIDCELSMAHVENMSYMFTNDSSLVQIEGLINMTDTANATTMNNMFSGCSSLTTLDVSHFDTMNVTNMGSMFGWCKKLTIIKGLENFNTAQVTDMNGLFYCCGKLATIDVSNFDTSNVKTFRDMFHGCKSLKDLKGLDKWDTSNAADMYGMFISCSSLTTIDISNFNTSNVTNMGTMFSGCSSLTTLDVSQLNTSNVTNMRYMFDSCKGLTTLDVSQLDTSNVIYMGNMFGWCDNLTTITGLDKWNTSNVTDMSQMFYECKKLAEVDVSHFNTENVTNFLNMFAYCESLTTLDLSNFNLKSITAQSQLNSFLYDTKSLTEIKAPTNLNGYTIELYYTFGMREMDSSMEGWTLLKGSKEFNILYNTLMKINVCTEYAKASELQAMYDGLTSEEKDKLATLSDDGGVILTDKLSYMVSYADYKANEATKTAETHLVISPVTGQYLVIVIACLSLALIGGYYFIQKKKYAK